MEVLISLRGSAEMLSFSCGIAAELVVATPAAMAPMMMKRMIPSANNVVRM
jgi:hypothetical protein